MADIYLGLDGKRWWTAVKAATLDLSNAMSVCAWFWELKNVERFPARPLGNSSNSRCRDAETKIEIFPTCVNYGLGMFHQITLASEGKCATAITMLLTVITHYLT